MKLESLLDVLSHSTYLRLKIGQSAIWEGYSDEVPSQYEKKKVEELYVLESSLLTIWLKQDD